VTAGDAVPERILGQIRKLLALAGSQNEHEAAVASAKATALLLKYNLVLAEVGERANRPLAADLDYFEHPVASEVTRWRARLCLSFARHGFCRVIVTRKPVRDPRTGRSRAARAIGLIGRPHDAEIVWFLYETVSTRISELASVYPAFGDGSVRSFLGPRQSFLLGAVVAVEERLEAERAAATAPAAASSEQALALIETTDRELETFMRIRFPNLTRSGGRGGTLTVDPGAYGAGLMQGREIPFTRGVGGGERLKLSG